MFSRRACWLLLAGLVWGSILPAAAQEPQRGGDDSERRDRGDRGDRPDRDDRGERGDRGERWRGRFGDRGDRARFQRPEGGSPGGPFGGGPFGGGPFGGGPFGGGPFGGGPFGGGFSPFGGGPFGGREGRGDADRRDRDRGDRDRNSNAGGSASKSGTAGPSYTTSLMPFGLGGDAAKLNPVPGFDGQANGPVKTKLEETYDERVLSYVDREFFSRHDTNGNGVLESDEWRSVQWGDDPKQDDKNNDGRLTREELAARMVRRWGFGLKQAGGAPGQGGPEREGRRFGGPFGGFGGPPGGGFGGPPGGGFGDPFGGGMAGPPGGGPSGPPADSGDSGRRSEGRRRSYAESLLRQYDSNKDGSLDRNESKEMRAEWQMADTNGDGRITLDELEAKNNSFSGGDRRGSGGSGDRPKRFLRPSERLPDGLPSWFARSDTDGDGQVMMAEYSTSWSDSKAAEFMRYDVDGDGVITPKEALAAEKSDKSKDRGGPRGDGPGVALGSGPDF